MEFLNKLYESNYFGIVLFAVIAFLVVTFLIVLFFGKKDEKKRKLEETNNIKKIENTEDAFKEVEAPAVPVNVESISPVNVAVVPPVEPVNYEINEPVVDAPVVEEVTPVAPEEPINFEVPVEPVAPISIEPTIEPQNVVAEEPKVEPIAIEPIVFEAPDTIVEPIAPIKFDTINESPVVEETPQVEPIIIEPIKFEVEEPTPVAPVIEETVTPIIMDTEKITPVYEEEKPIIEDTTIGDTYYKPMEEVEAKEVEVPNFDFDAIAKSISKELDALEENGRVNENVEVTPINNITNEPSTFSSVYVNKEVTKPRSEQIELPKRIDMPARKEEVNH